MSAETLLYTTLSGASGVTDLVSARIYPDTVPAEQNVPSVAYARTDTEYVPSIHSATPLGAFVSLEVVCMARMRATADSIADAVLAAVQAAFFIPTSRRAEFDADLNLWGTVLALRVWSTD